MASGRPVDGSSRCNVLALRQRPGKKILEYYGRYTAIYQYNRAYAFIFRGAPSYTRGMNNLEQLGWNDNWQQRWDDLALARCVPGRVIADHGASHKVAIPGEIVADASGHLRYASKQAELPKVGDWVAVQENEPGRGVIQAVLPRISEISRRNPGKKLEKQVMAANVDIAFLVQALDADFSPARLQRYLLQLGQQAITPVIVLNKADRAADVDARVQQVTHFGVEIVVASATEGQNIAAIAAFIAPGKTAVFLGSSGVGKSTITNALLGEQRQATQEVREADAKGRHTTTHRELFMLPGGGLLIDTPGIRELQLWSTEADLEAMYPDIEPLVTACRFADCSHTQEPGCAVLAALADGRLDEHRWLSYGKLQGEIQQLSAQQDINAAQDLRKSHKQAQREAS